LKQKEKDQIKELAYTEGSRLAWTTMLRECIRHLGYENPDVKKIGWIVEREEAIRELRQICEEFGDLDWENDLHLSDIIAKHINWN